MNFKNKPIYTILTLISILSLSIIVVFPLLWSLYLSLKPAHKMFIPGISFPIEITFDNYKSTLLNLQFLKSVSNGFLVAICTATISVIVGAPVPGVPGVGVGVGFCGRWAKLTVVAVNASARKYLLISSLKFNDRLKIAFQPVQHSKMTNVWINGKISKINR